jgi:hypothetical protein
MRIYAILPTSTQTDCALALVNCQFSSFALDNLWAAPSVWGLAKTMDELLWKIEIIENRSLYEKNRKRYDQVFVGQDAAFFGCF